MPGTERGPWVITDEEAQAIWEAWDKGEGRCLYCINRCPVEWWVICDCWMAPHPGEHACEECLSEEDTATPEIQTDGPGDIEDGGIIPF